MKYRGREKLIFLSESLREEGNDVVPHANVILIVIFMAIPITNFEMSSRTVDIDIFVNG